VSPLTQLTDAPDAFLNIMINRCKTFAASSFDGS
jgi:hypothetical protein